MRDKLNTCINLLTKAKELVSVENPNIDLALEFLEKAQEILMEFNEIPADEKVDYKTELLQIQSLGQLINQKLASEKNALQKKVLHNTKMTNAVKGYAKS